MRFVIRSIAFLLLAVALQGQVRIDPEVRARASTGGPLRVFFLLRDQPQRAILAKGAGQREAAAEIDEAITTQQETVARGIEALGAREIQRYRGVNLLSAVVTSSSIAALESMAEVAEIAVAGEGQGALSTSVPALGAPAMWSAGLTGTGQAVAIMDTGLKANHPAFAGIRVTGRTFHAAGRTASCYVDTATDFEDRNGHGTRVAGMVASRDAIHRGVARDLDALYIAKVLFQCADASFPSGRYLDSDVVAGLDWIALETPAKIINFSAGSRTPVEDSFLARLFDQYTENFGLSIVVAAGNTGSGAGTVWSPGIAHNVISVANLDHRRTVDRADDVVVSSSSRGPTLGGRFKPDIAAPGTLITAPSSLWESGTTFVAGNGTSFAAPHIAGALALLRQAGVTRPLAAKALLLATADGSRWRADSGWGSANLARAGSAVEGTVTAAASRLYRGVGTGTFRAMLTSYRRIDPSTNANLPGPALSAYELAGGGRVGTSNDPLQNVQEVTGTATSFALRVAATNAGQTFGLAIGSGVLVTAIGPRLALECTAPRAVAPVATIAVDCLARNSGDLRAFGVLARAGAASENLGVLEAGGSVSRRWTMPAPGGATEAAVTASLASISYDQSYSAGAALTVGIEAALTPSTMRAVAGNNQRGSVGSTLPDALTVEVVSAGGLPSPGIAVTFAAVNATVSPAMVLTDAQGRASATVKLGPTTGSVMVTAAAAIGSTAARIDFAATAVPGRPEVRRVANGASFQNPVAPGSIFSAGGIDLAAATAQASSLPLPTDLEGTSITVNGRRAPLFYVSPAQINAQIPVETAPGPAVIVVTTPSGVSAQFPINIARAGPGIFVFDSSRAVAQNEDLSLNTVESPAFVGSVITVYMTGSGPLDNPVETGVATPFGSLSRATLEASAAIGGKAAEILFLGMTPGLVGVLQANVRVPELTAGHYPIEITIGGVTSNAPLVTVFALP